MLRSPWGRGSTISKEARVVRGEEERAWQLGLKVLKREMVGTKSIVIYANVGVLSRALKSTLLLNLLLIM